MANRVQKIRNIKPRSKKDFRSKPIRDFVVFRPRDDLDPNSRLGMNGQRIVTSIRTANTTLPDTMGVVEVMKVGPWCKLLKPGDIAVFDLGAITREFTTAGNDQLVAREENFTVTIDQTGIPHPLPGFILTKANRDRMRAALFGNTQYIAPESVYERGIPARYISSQNQIQKAERSLGLDHCPGWRKRLGMTTHTPTQIPAFHHVYDEVVEVGSDCQNCGIIPGDLTTVTVELATKFTFRGETYRLSNPETSCHVVIDDAGILAASQAKNPHERSLTAHQGSGLIII